ncbi:O-methyltransferase [Seminavis robusta]|uniref:O-methyltransferase n=1 Tax=Seminavis robusta TaxID=568900 RepID=A0A9N8DTR1_9STRA|nr:O-methyltransferase [Seminavis robusta]|eukprot:Sro364_g127100.1 O-methyltransferase (673) ;mRNA; r:27954-29972
MTLPTKHPRQRGGMKGIRATSVLWAVIVAGIVWSAIREVNRSHRDDRDAMTNENSLLATPDEVLQRLLQQSSNSNGEQQQQQQQQPVSSSSKAVVVSSEKEIVHTTTTTNVMVVAYNASSEEQLFSLVENQIAEFHNAQDPKGVGTRQPVVLRGVWEPPSDSWKSERAFLKAYSTIPYYIKDKYVQVKDETCVAQFGDLWNFIAGNKTHPRKSLLAFTNDKENRALFGQAGEKLPFDIPPVVQHIDSFSILSTMTKGQSHEFHKHGESWIAQAVGYKVWWFLPPTAKRPVKVNACDYLNGKEPLPKGAIKTTIQGPGDVIWFPHDYYHATCSLSEWTVGIGRQLGPRIRQNFKDLPLTIDNTDRTAVEKTLQRCSGEGSNTLLSRRNLDSSNAAKDKDWKWYGGDVNKYYNDLENDHKRNPNDVASYAVHRWLGDKRSTETHYELIHEGILKHYQKSTKTSAESAPLEVLDAGCGLGSALMWMEAKQPAWKLQGRTLSEEQAKFIQTTLPTHRFQIKLDSYDNIINDDTPTLDVIYSIEAAIHSTDMQKTLRAWATRLKPKHGMVVLIDDFLQPGASRDDEDVDLFARSWLANSLYTVTEMNQMARRVGLTLVESRDLLAEYRVVELNYRNKVPSLDPDKQKNHQGWMGSKYRQKLTVEGKIGYNMVIFRKM